MVFSHVLIYCLISALYIYVAYCSSRKTNVKATLSEMGIAILYLALAADVLRERASEAVPAAQILLL